MSTSDVAHGRALLHCRLAQNAAVRIEDRQGLLVLWLPLRQRWWMSPPVAWFFPFRKQRGFALDRVGSELWRALAAAATGGELPTLEWLVENFAAAHQLRFHEARVSVTQFLKMLVQRRLVAIVADGEQPQGARHDALARGPLPPGAQP